uniref:Ectodysplasin A2 receptor n=1 Tax=Xenopus tropicalis TaxID=8364 RepID=F7D7R4_XENTR
MELPASQLFCLLFLTELGLIFNSASGCLESEFEDASGKCVPCTQCGPGQELSEDCGSERDLRCVPCRPGRYKEDRGHQRCLRCLPCHIINRVLKANCTLTTNSVCGECLLGYYSKTRIGGLQELECFPCTAHTPSTESQFSTPSPPRDPVVLVAVIAVTLSLLVVALVTFSVICCGRFFKSQCQRGNILNPKQPSVELCMLPSDPVKPYYKRSVSETQPLIRNSACSDCFSSQEPQSTAARSCATEQQHWSHAPVECTELDLQNFSSDSTGSPNQSEHIIYHILSPQCCEDPVL